MLNMRIVRSPLPEKDSATILAEYNRLTGGRIPPAEFRRWVVDSPEGPAWHAILETDEGRIVGHTSVFPIRASGASSDAKKVLIPAKSEYSYLHADFRKEKIRGYQTAGRPPFIILLDELFQHCHRFGWSPIFASTNEKNQVFTRRVGLRPVEFPLWECLLVLRPLNSAKFTPNLTNWQRTAVFSAGVVHGAFWPIAAKALSLTNGISARGITVNGIQRDRKPLSFFEDAESLAWRYRDGQYVRFAFGTSRTDYVIAKHGEDDRFLRVCQWRLQPETSFLSLLGALVGEARQNGALGVRWAVYDGDSSSERLVSEMRRLGLLCARRTRIVMIHKDDCESLDPALWRMNDSLFSFDP